MDKSNSAEDFRRHTAKMKKRSEKRQKRDSAKQKRHFERFSKIREFSKTNPVVATDLMMEEILVEMRKNARQCLSHCYWKPMDYADYQEYESLQNEVKTRLEKMGFKIEVHNGHEGEDIFGGHKDHRCRESIYNGPYPFCCVSVLIKW